MNRIVYQLLNPPGMVLLVSVGVAIQTSLFSSYPLSYFQPDVVLLAVVWFALRRSFTEGGILTLIVANLSEIHSSAPKGLYLVSYMVIYLLLRTMSRYLLISQLRGIIAATLFSTLLWHGLNLMILNSLKLSAAPPEEIVKTMCLGTLMNALLGIKIYPFFEKFDWLTFKDPKARQAIDHEFQLGDEGL